mmetsp:Transcript_31782/g.91561  ORF Transcript_31782/g.91561 Transcript_31782/m.91561 type:complete len:210 (+) Transcript_31782:1950-2579(+)
MEELDHDVVNLLRALRLRGPGEVQLEVGRKLRARLLLRFCFLLLFLFCLGLRRRFLALDRLGLLRFFLACLQENCGDDVLRVEDLLVKLLLLRVVPDHRKLVLDLLVVFLISALADAGSVGVLLLRRRQGLIELFGQSRQRRLQLCECLLELLMLQLVLCIDCSFVDPELRVDLLLLDQSRVRVLKQPCGRGLVRIDDEIRQVRLQRAT